MPRFIHQGTWTDGNGVVVDEGTVTVYLAGGSTLATIYATETATSAATGSVVESDEYGHFVFWVDPGDYTTTQKFKYTLSKTAFESKTWDNIVIFRAKDWIDVKDYGAEGDDATDDVAAFQAAFAAAPDNTYTVFIPPGHYLISERVDFSCHISGIPRASIVEFTTAGEGTAYTDHNGGFKTSEGEGITVYGIKIVDTQVRGAIFIEDSTDVTVDNCQFIDMNAEGEDFNSAHAVFSRNSVNTVVKNSRMDNVAYWNIYFSDGGSGKALNNWITNYGSIAICSDIEVDSVEIDSNYVDGLVLRQAGVYVNPGAIWVERTDHVTEPEEGGRVDRVGLSQALAPHAFVTLTTVSIHRRPPPMGSPTLGMIQLGCTPLPSRQTSGPLSSASLPHHFS